MLYLILFNFTWYMVMVNDLHLGSKYHVITDLAGYQGILGYCMKPETFDLGFGNNAKHYGMSDEVSDLCSRVILDQ